MSLPPLVAVVIVNYDGYELTRDCLLSFAAVKYERYVLIVVDNASRDDSVELLQAEFPQVEYVTSRYNLGFTGGNNLGLERAKELNAEYVFFLNNDTTVSENILGELSTFTSTNPEVGLVAPLNYYYDSKEVISFGGGRINRNTGMYTQDNEGKTLHEIKDEVIYCTFIAGTALFLRTAVADRVGGFNDDYFLTSEESELCIRIADEGYKLAVITSCCVWHKVSRTLRSCSTLRDYYLFRNRLLFVKRNSIDFSIRDLIALMGYHGRCFASYIVKKQDFFAAKGLVLGVIDFFRGVTGPGRYAKQLNAAHKNRVAC